MANKKYSELTEEQKQKKRKHLIKFYKKNQRKETEEEKKRRYSIRWYKKNRKKAYKKTKNWRKKNPKKRKELALKPIKNLVDSYIRKLLTVRKFPKESITPELIETQKLIIQIKRLSKEKKCKTSKNLEVVC
jgi:hypothetical protein